jgi:zinc/manganese transport system permease protein
MSHVVRYLVEPGFFSNGPVRTALVVGALVAMVSATVGVFTVMRGQAFAGEALGDVGAAGGSGAFLVGANPLVGFLAVALAGAGVIELIGTKRAHSRELATGIVLGVALSIAALFLYLDSTTSNASGASIQILFGSMFLLGSQTVPIMIGLSLVALGVVLSIYRMLLLSSLNGDLAASRGIPVRLIGIAYLFSLAISVALAAMTIGAVLSTALLIGPPAAALRLVRRPGLAVVVAVAIGVGATWVGILASYDSYYWPPAGRGWPVSSLVIAAIFIAYLLARVVTLRRMSTRRHHPGGVDASPRGA